METVIEARPVHEEDVLKAVPETILEAKPVMEECAHNLNETYAASQVTYRKEIQMKIDCVNARILRAEARTSV